MNLHANSTNFPGKLMLYKRDIALLHNTTDSIVDWHNIDGTHSFLVKDVLSLVKSRAGHQRINKNGTWWIEFDYSQFTSASQSQVVIPTTLTLKEAAEYLKTNVPALGGLHLPTLSSRLSLLSKLGVKLTTMTDLQAFIQNGASLSINTSSLV